MNPYNIKLILEKHIQDEVKTTIEATDVTVKEELRGVRYTISITHKIEFFIDDIMLDKQGQTLNLILSNVAKNYRQQLIKTLLQLKPTWNELGIYGSRIYKILVTIINSDTSQSPEDHGLATQCFAIPINDEKWQAPK